nr:hypothetical protein [Thermoanaerobacter sp. YS13]
MTQEKKDEVKVQILKCWDDKEPICFTKITNDEKDKNGEDFKSLTDSSWIKKGEKFGEEKLRERIAPWLSTLFKAEHLSLLIGSGLTNVVCNIAKCEVTSWKNVEFEWITEEIKEKIEKEAQKSAYRAGRGEANLEDKIRYKRETSYFYY